MPNMYCDVSPQPETDDEHPPFSRLHLAALPMPFHLLHGDNTVMALIAGAPRGTVGNLP